MEKTKIALLFPGQGAQYVGMGKDIYDNYAAARKVFDAAAAILGFDLKKICFAGPLSELTRSAVCQPAVLTAGIAVLETLKTLFPQIVFHAAGCAGLSLGEYSALTACGSLRFEDAVLLVHKRGQYMDEAARENPGTMACILGLELERVREICRQSGTETANINAPGQAVISGTFENITKAGELIKQLGSGKIVPLEVSGPFHSSLMAPAAEKLKKILEDMEIKTPAIPFVSNVTADFVTDPQEIRRLLIEQVAHTTLWMESMRAFMRQGIMTGIEIGPGKVLRGLMLRIEKNFRVINAEKSADFGMLTAITERKA